MTGFIPPQELPTFEASVRDAESGSPDARWVAAIALGTITGENQAAAIDTLTSLLAD